MSLHQEELPRRNSGPLSRNPTRFGIRPRGSRSARLSNPLLRHLFPEFSGRWNFFEGINVDPLILPMPKPWHKALKLKDRQHIIDELINFVPRFNDRDSKIERAINLEGFMCEAANSMEEYEMLLTLFQRASGKYNEESSVFDFRSNCSTDPEDSDDSDDSRGSSFVLNFSATDEENSFSSDHDSSHYGGSESDE